MSSESFMMTSPARPLVVVSGSSQFKVGMLMTVPMATKDTVIVMKGDQVSKPDGDITLHPM
ncbi:hypothetical protein, partial [Escherichia coli]|uniref:hypothetical protein n=1 Tax=Escherichia coli TaxID=562 RepID=UPI0019648048